MAHCDSVQKFVHTGHKMALLHFLRFLIRNTEDDASTDTVIKESSSHLSDSGKLSLGQLPIIQCFRDSNPGVYLAV